MVSITPFSVDSHYDALVSMWTDWGWNIPPKDYLPDTGLVITLDNKPAVACLYYTTNSKGVLMEWLVADKTLDKVVRKQLVRYILKRIIKDIKGAGYKYIQTFTSNMPLINNYYLDMGFNLQGKGGAQGLLMRL